MVGVENADKLQRTLRNIAEKDCYPPIDVQCEVLRLDAKDVVAAVVPYSRMRPHFAGAAFVRIGSESVQATEQVYQQLLLSQDDKRRHLLDRADAIWTVELQSKHPGAAWSLRDAHAVSQMECRIEEVTAFYVRFLNIGSGRLFTEMLQDVHISYDDQALRPRALIWPTDR